MKQKGQPNRVINRFGNRYTSDKDGFIESTNAEETALFEAYGFVSAEELTPKT
jgi:hypothetical protein